jgi:hypothetical protein
MPPRRKPTPTAEPLSPVELERIVPLLEAERLSGLSRDTLYRRHADKIIRLSPRRSGMRLKHALMLTQA